MTKILLTILCVAFTYSKIAWGRVAPTDLRLTILQSDLILDTTPIVVDEKKGLATLKINRVLKGKYSQKTLDMSWEPRLAEHLYIDPEKRGILLLVLKDNQYQETVRTRSYWPISSFSTDNNNPVEVIDYISVVFTAKEKARLAIKIESQNNRHYLVVDKLMAYIQELNPSSDTSGEVCIPPMPTSSKLPISSPLRGHQPRTDGTVQIQINQLPSVTITSTQGTSINQVPLEGNQLVKISQHGKIKVSFFIDFKHENSSKLCIYYTKTYGTWSKKGVRDCQHQCQ